MRDLIGYSASRSYAKLVENSRGWLDGWMGQFDKVRDLNLKILVVG